MDEHPTAAGRLLRLYRRIAGDFAATVDPLLGPWARLGAGLEGLAALAAMGAVLLAAYAVVLIPLTPDIKDIRRAAIDQPSLLISSDGKRLAAYSRLNRDWVLLENISPLVIDALIATEDHRFYEHGGLDFLRMAGAMASFVGGEPEGASTLTQQLARNLFPEEIGRQRTVTRKIKEVITALRIERAYGKNEILETYLNTVPFLYNAFGIEMAARTYFDKPAAKLNAIESATLVGMLKGTSYYNPVLNPGRALKRRNVVLAQMVKHGRLSAANFEKLKSRPIRLDFERQQGRPGPAPHFAEHVRRWLVEWADLNDYDIHADGLRVHTTIDARLQALANQAVTRQMEALQAVADVEWGQSSARLVSTSAAAYAAMRRRVSPFAHFWATKPELADAFIRESDAYRREIGAGAAPEKALAQLKGDEAFMTRLRAEKTRLQAGFVAIDPVTAQVKAWVGSRDFATDQYDHVARAQRQPGSTFKPFVYGAALEDGMPPEREFIDQAVEIPLADGTVWRPSDASEPSGLSLSASDGLILSKNTITVQVMQQVGPRKTASLARNMGVSHSPLEPVPALALGTSPVTLLEMVSAYGTIAAGGEYRAPLMVTRITDKEGQVLAEFGTEARRALSPQTSSDLIEMMRGVIDRGTGAGIRTRFGVRADVAGKTGTTQNNTDGWFILMHPRLVAGAWVGFNDARITLRSSYWGQGAHNALYVIGDFFRQALNSSAIDARAEFPGYGTSLVGSILDRFEAWMGWRNPRSSGPPPAPGTEARKDPSSEGIFDRARQAIRAYERWHRELEKRDGNAN